MLASRDARAYTAKRSVNGSPSKRLYGCWKATGRRITLADAFEDGYTTSATFSDVRLAGRYVAWYGTATDVSCKASCPPDYVATKSRVNSWDLRRRKRVRSADATVTSPGLVLTERAGLAWVEGSGPSSQVRAADSSGTRVLDTGAIAPASLRAEISIVSWVRDGVERFARLR